MKERASTHGARGARGAALTFRKWEEPITAAVRVCSAPIFARCSDSVAPKPSANEMASSFCASRGIVLISFVHCSGVPSSRGSPSYLAAVRR
jgi:hypothetical protein